MSAFPPFLGVSPAAPRSLLGRRNLCRDSCLLWPLFSPVASLSICWWGHGPSVSLRSGDRGWLKQRRVVTWSWGLPDAAGPLPPTDLAFPPPPVWGPLHLCFHLHPYPGTVGNSS